MVQRRGAAGPYETQVESLDWDGSAPLPLVLLPAGHEPGQYVISGVIVVRVAPGAGVVDRVATWSAPNGAGAQSLGLTVPAGIAGLTGTFMSDQNQTLQSDGESPIQVSFNPGGIVDPAEIDVYAVAFLAAPRA